MGFLYEQTLIQHAIYRGEGCVICGKNSQEESLLSYSFETESIVHLTCLQQKVKELAEGEDIWLMASEFYLTPQHHQA